MAENKACTVFCVCVRARRHVPDGSEALAALFSRLCARG